MKLSEAMQAALDMATANGGKLRYWKGGFWSYPGCPVQIEYLPTAYEVPRPYFGTQTIRSLISRGLMRISATSEGDGRGYMTEVEVV